MREVIGNGRGVAVAVVTRGHSEDEQCMRAVIETRPDYVGLIGSKRRTSIVIDRLREAGASDDVLRHELVHVSQMGELGLFRFLWRYIAQYIRNRRRGMTHDAAYRAISFEVEAFGAEEGSARIIGASPLTR